MPPKNKIDDRTKEHIKQLLATGMAKNAVAKQVGVSWATVDKVSKEEKDSLESLRDQKKSNGSRKHGKPSTCTWNTSKTQK